MATTISLLRGLGVPLPVVQEVLAAPDRDAAAAVLAGERDRLHAELTRREETLRSLDGLLHTPERLRYDVAIADHPPRSIVGMTAPVRAASLDADTGTLCRRVDASAPGRGPITAVYPIDLDETFNITVGHEGSGGRDLPGGAWAVALHVGPYAELPLAYAAVLEHARDRGHPVRGPVTETYLTDPTTARPQDLVTRICVALGS